MPFFNLFSMNFLVCTKHTNTQREKQWYCTNSLVNAFQESIIFNLKWHCNGRKRNAFHLQWNYTELLKCIIFVCVYAKVTCECTHTFSLNGKFSKILESIFTTAHTTDWLHRLLRFAEKLEWILTIENEDD